MTDQLSGDDATVEQQLKDLRDDVTSLQHQLDGVTTLNVRTDGDTAAPAPRPVETSQPASAATPVAAPRTGRAWRTMTAQQAAEAWRTLFDFVDWMTDRYDLHDTLPPCWYRHGGFVEELHALHLAWIGAYLHPTARPADPTSWHDLQQRTLARLRDADRLGCIAGTHRDTAPGAPPDELEHDRAARTAYADADAHRRARRAAAGTGS